MMLDTTIEIDDAVVIITPVTKGHYNNSIWMDDVSEILATNNQCSFILIDMMWIKILTSPDLGVIRSLHEQALRLEACLVLYNVKEDLYQTFVMTNLVNLLHVYEKRL